MANPDGVSPKTKICVKLNIVTEELLMASIEKAATGAEIPQDLVDRYNRIRDEYQRITGGK